MNLRIDVSDSDGHLDAAVGIRIRGCQPGSTVQFSAMFRDDENVEWSSAASFCPSAAGLIDLSADAPLAGSWSGVDPDGPFWSMAPCPPEQFDRFRLDGNPALSPGVPSAHRAGMPTFVADAPITVILSAQVDGQASVRTQVRRHRFPPGVTETVVTDGRLRGVLFEPVGLNQAPGVLLLSGSEGGIKRVFAALLAARGFAVLALGYFNVPDLPARHVRIPLEYFAEGVAWLRTRLKHDRIGLVGGSRGGEGVLAFAAAFPECVKAVVALVASDIYTASPMADGSVLPAWTLAGLDLPCAWNLANAGIALDFSATTPINTRQALYSFCLESQVYERSAIPIERMRCPVMFIGGEDDQCWPSHKAHLRAIHRLKQRAYAWPVEHLSDPDAGHLSGYPGLPTVMCDSAVHPVEPIFFTLGGTPRGTARLQRRSWEASLRFLHSHLDPTKG